jgi:hypothetical protein
MAEFTFEDLYDALDVLIDEDDFVQLPALEQVLHITDQAVFINLEGFKEKWIPKSVLRVDTDETLYVKEWFYRKEF